MKALSLEVSAYGSEPFTKRPYPPHPTQAKVLEWVDSVREGRWTGQGIPTLFIQHGVNAGGTRCMLAPVLEYLVSQPGLRALIARRDFNDLRLSVMQTFIDVVPEDLIVNRNQQEHWFDIAAKGGLSRVFFRELKDVSGLGSQEFAVILVCEAAEISEMAFRTLQRRCRQGQLPAFLLLEGNPPGYGHWLEAACDPKSPRYIPEITRLKLPSTENWQFMAPHYRESLNLMPAEWQRRFILAETGALPSGTPVYPSFAPSVHVRPTTLIPDRPILRGWDFGYRRPAALFCQSTDDGQLIIHREWMPFELPEDEFIQGVIYRTNLWFGEHVCVDYGDPAAKQRDPQGIATLQRLQQHGIRLIYRQTTYAHRIPLVNQRFSKIVRGEPAVIVDPQCDVLIQGLAGGYHFPE